MKKVKIAFWIIVIGFFALVVYQNQDFFLSKHSLGLNLYVKAYRTVALPNAVLFAGFFLIGWLIAYAFGLAERYKTGKANKSLKSTIASQQDAISAMKKDIDALKGKASSPAERPVSENHAAAQTADASAAPKE